MAPQGNSPLSGQTAIVTGASSGIGRATTHSLARDGSNLVVAARRKERLETLVEELEAQYDIEAVVAPTDVRNQDEVAAMIEVAVDVFGGVDTVVNNAGLARGSDVSDLSTEEYRLMMDTNVDGTFFTTRAALPHLRESEGHLVLMSSYAGNYPYPRNPVYAASRWWIRGFAHSVEAQVGPDGVGVTVICPAEVRTRVWDDTYDEGEILEPETIADAITYAVSQEAPGNVSQMNLHWRGKLGRHE